MTNLVVGLGVQGNKRIQHIKTDVITLDKFNTNADYQDLGDIKLDKIRHVYICTPESEKFFYIKKFLKKKINVLVEKPLVLSSKQNSEIKKLLSKKDVTLYTAYNHRFEPHIEKVKKTLSKKTIGKIYYVNLYYGNGTCGLWKNSWREKKNNSIIHDLGVHLIDIFLFWFGFLPKVFYKRVKVKNELKCYDFVNFKSKTQFISNFSTSVIDWKNKFKIDIIGSMGSIHIDNLCKWGPSTLLIRKRIFPSGKPIERKFILELNDPTWKKEEKYFKKICRSKINNFGNDILISKALEKI